MRQRRFEPQAGRCVPAKDICRDSTERSSHHVRRQDPLRDTPGSPWQHACSGVNPERGEPQPPLTSDSIKCQGALPGMMLNTFDSKAKTFGSLMISPQRNHMSGSTHRRTGISIATRDTTESLLFCSVPERDERWVEESGMGELNAPSTQASSPSSQFTAYTEEDQENDGTNVECAWARVSAAPCHAWLGCWGVCVFVGALPLYPATPGWGVLRGCVCLGWGFGCAPPPGWGVGVCLCLWARSACTSPLLAGVCAVGVCAWARTSAAPRHSWLGCWGVCVFVCALRLYPATPGWGVRSGYVCLGSGVGCAAPLLVGVSGVCVFVGAPRLYSATPGSGVRCGCVCLGWGSGCALPLLAGVLGCVCLCVRAPHVLATPGWGVRCGCVCLGLGFGCALPLLAGVFGAVFVCGRPLLVPRHSWLGCAVWVCVLGLGFRLRPATPGWGVGVCVCLCARSACTQPLLAGVCAVAVCAWALASAAPRHSWLGCWRVCVFVGALCLYPATPGWGALWVCVLGMGFRLRPATPCWSVGGCVSLCALSACTPPLLAAVCGSGVCAWAWVSSAPRHSGWGFGGCVCL